MLELEKLGTRMHGLGSLSKSKGLLLKTRLDRKADFSVIFRQSLPFFH